MRFTSFIQGCISLHPPFSQLWFYSQFFYPCGHAKPLQSCPTLCDPMDCSPPGSSVHGILPTRILEWVALLFCNRSSLKLQAIHLYFCLSRHLFLAKNQHIPLISWAINLPVYSADSSVYSWVSDFYPPCSTLWCFLSLQSPRWHLKTPLSLLRIHRSGISYVILDIHFLEKHPLVTL